MTKQVQRRRGTSTQHTSFTGAEGEISVNTTNKSIHVHDGTTAGGVEAARADLANVSDTSLNNALSGNTLASLTITSADINGGTIDGTTIGGTSPAAVTTTSLVATTADINGGTVDGAVIGGSSAAAITGTTITATGDVTIPDKIVHAGDTNTAIRFPAADTVTVETAGVERVRVDSAGNVGIGTTSPAAPLEVNGVGSPTSQTALIRSSGVVGIHLQSENNSSRNIFFQDNNDDQNSRIFALGTLAGGDAQLRLDAGTFMRFDANGSERMRITSTGNVGIGTSSPSQKLHVATGDGLGSSDALLRLGNTGAFNALLLGYSGAGDVTDGAPAIYATSTIGSTGLAGHIAYKARSDSARDHIFYTGTTPTERLRINSAGNVGIGTSSPAVPLQVNGTANALVFTGGANVAVGGFNYPLRSNVESADSGVGITNAANVVGGPNIRFGHARGSYSSLSALLANDELGILSFRGYDGATWRIGAGLLSQVDSAYSAGSMPANLVFSTGGTTERMRITSAGNVGIGTSSPNAASIIDAQSTTKGVRFPNMTTTQKNAMANVAGNVIFDTTLGKLCVNSGSGWETITSI